MSSILGALKTSDAIEQFVERVAASLADETFARLVLSSPNTGDLQKILGRLIMLKNAPHLSLTLRHATRDVTKNIPVAEAAKWLRYDLNGNFQTALLCTTRGDYQLIRNKAGVACLVRHKASLKTAPSREHDESRKTLLDRSANDWLHGLGVVDRDGKLRASMADKHRQISHYLEIISHLARDCGWVNSEGQAPQIPISSSENQAAGPCESVLQFADMGSGKGYLTFGLWHLFHRVWKRRVHVIGVEARADLVSTTNRLAKEISAEGLEFVCGEIQTANLPRVDGLIALHACDTATDDAIRRGIELSAKLIVVAPCCQKELRPQLGTPEPLSPVLRHGVMAERMAEWTTDGLRALFLEWAGYRTKLMEFVGSEHTPKNLMIAAIREGEPFANPAARERIVKLKEFFGIKHHSLDVLLK